MSDGPDIFPEDTIESLDARFNEINGDPLRFTDEEIEELLSRLSWKEIQLRELCNAEGKTDFDQRMKNRSDFQRVFALGQSVAYLYECRRGEEQERKLAAMPADALDVTEQLSDFFDARTLPDGRYYKPEFIKPQKDESRGEYEARKRKESPHFYSVIALGEDIERIVNAFLLKADEGQKERFFDRARALAHSYVKRAPAPDDVGSDPECALMYGQIYGMLASPRFISDGRAVRAIEEFADLRERTQPPWTDSMFRIHGPETSTIRRGFELGTIKNLERIIDSRKIWRSRDFTHNLGFYLSAIADVLAGLPEDFNDATSSLRLKLFHYSCYYGRDEIPSILARSFSSENEKAALQDIIDKFPASPPAIRAEDILLGKEEQKVW